MVTSLILNKFDFAIFWNDVTILTIMANAQVASSLVKNHREAGGEKGWQGKVRSSHSTVILFISV